MFTENELRAAAGHYYVYGFIRGAGLVLFCSQVEPLMRARTEIIEGQGGRIWSCGYIYQYGTNYLQQITRITTHADKK